MTYELLQCVKVLPGAEGLPADKDWRHEFLRWRGLVIATFPEYNSVHVLCKNGAVSDWHPDDLAPAKLV